MIKSPKGLYWANFGLDLIIFFMNLKMGQILFADKAIYFMGIVLADFIFLPGISFLENRTYYTYADSVSENNPLYVRKYFRQSAGKSMFWANLKGLYWCQVCLSVITLGSWGYVLSAERIPIMFVSNMILNILGCIYWIIFLVWFIFRTYYCWRYNEDFRFIQNTERIWQPFSNLAKTHNLGAYSPFENHYYVHYIKLRENLRMSCSASGYQYVDSYEMHNAGDRTDIYIKRMENEIRIFLLIHLQEYTEDAMKQLNDIFADFWKTYVGKNNRVENAAVLFLLCVEECNKELKERLLSVCSVDQKKGRNRVAAVLTYYGKPSLEILESYGIFREKKKYRELRGELLRLLGMSEKNNHKSYGDRAEYGLLKEISEADLDDMLNNW